MHLIDLNHRAIGTHPDRLYIFNLPQPTDYNGLFDMDCIRLSRHRSNNGKWVTEYLDTRGRVRGQTISDSFTHAIQDAQEKVNEIYV